MRNHQRDIPLQGINRHMEPSGNHTCLGSHKIEETQIADHLDQRWIDFLQLSKTFGQFRTDRVDNVTDHIQLNRTHYPIRDNDFILRRTAEHNLHQRERELLIKNHQATAAEWFKLQDTDGPTPRQPLQQGVKAQRFQSIQFDTDRPLKTAGESHGVVVCETVENQIEVSEFPSLRPGGTKQVAGLRNRGFGRSGRLCRTPRLDRKRINFDIAMPYCGEQIGNFFFAEYFFHVKSPYWTTKSVK